MSEWDQRTDETAPRAEAVYRSLAAAKLVKMSGKGGGRLTVQWGASEIVSHGIGMAVAAQATAAAKLVPIYRNLVFSERHISQGSSDPAESAPAPKLGAVLGDVLDALLLAGAHGPSGGMSGVEVLFGLGRPTARLLRSDRRGNTWTDHYLMQDQPGLPGFQQESIDRPPAASIWRTARLTEYTLGFMADLLRDTLEYEGTQLPLSPSGTGNGQPGIENAALPGAAPSKAGPGGKPRNRDARTQDHGADSRGSNLSASVSSTRNDSRAGSLSHRSRTDGKQTPAAAAA